MKSESKLNRTILFTASVLPHKKYLSTSKTAMLYETALKPYANKSFKIQNFFFYTKNRNFLVVNYFTYDCIISD